MSGSFGAADIGGGAQAVSAAGAALTSDLMEILQAKDIVPGDTPSYQLCKAIFAGHPLGGLIAEAPIAMAQSQERTLSVDDGPEQRLLDAFHKVWDSLDGIGATEIIHRAMVVARVYGVSALVMGARGQNPAKPIDRTKLHDYDLFFNVLDPLNVAGSLVLSQDANSPDYQKPHGVRSGGQYYHPSNCVVMLNEPPFYILYTPSAFGFSGRSVFQRALYPLKSYIQTMITNDMVAYKAGVIVAKMKQETSNTNRRVWNMFAWKRGQVKTATTGNVLSIGVEESVESINLQMLAQPYELARSNILKDISSSLMMPAPMLSQETMVHGFGEGSEDAKSVSKFTDGIRIGMRPLYDFFTDVTQHIAWCPQFYADLVEAVPEWGKISYEVAFNQWRNSFKAVWPNLLVEPDSEQILVEDVKFKSVVALIETLAPALDPENRAKLIAWAADEINGRKKLFTSDLDIDIDELLANGPQNVTAGGRGEGKEPEVPPFAYEDAQASHRMSRDEAVTKLRELIEDRKRARVNAAA